MPEQVLLNNQPYQIQDSDLPCLITYAHKAGGSHFSVTLVADLFSRGTKILFLTAYPMAKDNFLKQVGEDHSRIAFVNNPEELVAAQTAQAIILESGNEQLFLEAAQNLTDFQERVIFIKNIEVFSEKVFDLCLPLQRIILSGTLDECKNPQKIADKKFQTIIAFSRSETPLPIEVPELAKYAGYLKTPTQSGVVSISAVSVV
jgi:hypothetical protein